MTGIIISWLDNTVAIGFLAGEQRIRAHFAAARARSEEVALSSISCFELEYGAALSDRPVRNREGLQEFFSHVPIAPFTEEAAHVAGQVRAILKQNGTPIGPYDVLIAGDALSEGAVLITNNIREFARVPGLTVEDWLTP